MLESRTIATVGGGDLILTDSPVDGVVGGWVQEPGGKLGSRHGFMLSLSSASELLDGLRLQAALEGVKTFEGSLSLSWRRWGVGDGDRQLAILWFYPWGSSEAGFTCRLYEGAIEVAIEALAEACEGPPAAASAEEAAEILAAGAEGTSVPDRVFDQALRALGGGR